MTPRRLDAPSAVDDLSAAQAVIEDQRRELAELRAQLREAQDTLDAIRAGDVDAVVVGDGDGGHQVYTPEGADRPYRRLVEEMQEGALMLAASGSVLYCNRALGAMLAASTEAIVGGALEPFVAPEERAALAELLAGGGRGEFNLLGEDGARRPVQISFSDLPGPGGERILCGIVTDLAEPQRHARELAEAEARHAADQAVRDREARYRLILESATDYAIVATDLEGRVTLWNAGARAILGWEEAEILGEPAPLIWTSEDLAAGVPAEEMREAREQGRAEDERWHLRQDGSRFWANGLMMPLRGSDGHSLLGYLKILRDRTQSREAEATLRSAEERYRLAARATNDAIWDWDLARNHVRWNEALTAAYGHALRDVEPTGDWWIGHVHPDDRARIDDSIHAVIDGAGTSWSDEYRFLRRDGTFADVLDRGFVIRDEAGRAVRMIGAMLDLSERKRAEAERDRARTLLQVFAEAVPGVVYAKDREGRMLVANRGTTELIGKPPAFFLGRTDAEFLDDPAQAAAVMANDRRVMEGGQAEQIEEEVRLPDGTPAVWLSTKAPLRDEAGAVVGLIGSSVDITARKRAEAALRELNETLENRVAERTAERDRLWRVSQDLLLVARFDGAIEAVNPAWTVTLGWEPGELVGRSFLGLVHPDDLGRTVAAAGLLSEGETIPLFENRYRHEDGSYRWLSWTATPEVGLIYAHARDITAEKERQAALEQAQEQLRQAQKMEAVGQLTGGIAHDFNNLLTGITGSLELLQKRVGEGRFAGLDRYTTVAMTSATRAAALTQRLLAFARRQSLEPKTVDVNRLVADMEDLVRRTVGEAIVVETALAGGLWPARCDANQLESALLNLCINARDAMPEGGRLTVETQNTHLDGADPAAAGPDVAAGSYVMIAVTDTGTGMPPDVIARAFEPFFTTKPIGQGTGLGLSMLYGFIKQSGGHVRMVSEVGRGTTARLYLPRDRDGHAEEECPPAKAAPARPGETVLVVEDEAAVRMLITETLEELGYAAREAVDGRSALPILEDASVRIDLLITDVGLPGGMNGRQLADRARELRPNLKVLFITGYAGNAAVGNGLLEQGMDLITKPFSLGALAEKIRSTIAPQAHAPRA